MRNRSNDKLPAIFVDTLPLCPSSNAIPSSPTLLEIYDVNYVHFHRFIELGLCVSGSGTCYVEDSSFSFSKGDIQIIFPFQKHLSKSTSSEPCLWYWSFIDLTDILPIGGFTEIDKVKTWINKEMALCGIIDSTEYSQITELCKTLINATFHPDPSIVHPRQEYAINILRLILALSQSSKDIENKLQLQGGAQLTKIAPALDCIKNELGNGDPLLVSELSKKCNMSAANFRRVFYKAIGLSPKDYITACAMRKTKILLLTTDMKMVDIAMAIGFQNISGFNRSFSQFTGISPSDYRKQYR